MPIVISNTLGSPNALGRGEHDAMNSGLFHRFSLAAWRPLAWLFLVAAATAFAQTGAGPASAPFSAAPTAPGPLNSIRNWLGGSGTSTELLPPDQAFQIAVRAKDADTLIAELIPASGDYLYRDRISFSITDPPTASVTSVLLPKGEPKADPTFGTVQVYHQPFEAIIALRQAGERVDQVQLRASYQGCNEPLGVCYPPIEKTVTLALPAAAGSLPVQVGAAPVPTAVDSSNADTVVQLFTRSSRWVLVAAFFGFGVLLAFTPCMLPMIPILSGIIVGHGQNMTRRHALGLSAVYVLAMAITYALAGVAAGLAGSLLSAYLQSPWVLGSFATIFVLLALSMFGLYELQLPTAFQTRLAAVSDRIKGARRSAPS